MDEATHELLLKAEQRARDVIKSHRPKLDKLIAELEEQETLHKEEIEKCLGPTHLRKIESND